MGRGAVRKGAGSLGIDSGFIQARRRAEMKMCGSHESWKDGGQTQEGPGLEGEISAWLGQGKGSAWEISRKSGSVDRPLHCPGGQDLGPLPAG